MAEAKVLVVDDDEAVRGVVRAALERVGIDVHLAPDGHVALRALAGERFDLVALDWHMPGLSGLEVLEAIGRDHPGLPVVICTGAGEADRDLALAAGAVDHVTKDLPVLDFARRIHAILAGEPVPDHVADGRPAPVAGDAPSSMVDEVARIGHELHNHLTVVLGHADLARRLVARADPSVPDRDQVIADLDAVTGAAERIGDLSRRLQALAESRPSGRAEDASGGAPDATGGPSGTRILLVEDDLDLRETTERLLGQEGYEVLAAPDVASALEVLRAAGEVDLCITDLQLPGSAPGDGAARLAAAAPATPLLVMSGHSADVLAASSAPETAAFLPKPFTRDRLLDAIRGALHP